MNLRADFPVLAQAVHGKPLCYLDSAASAQMPLPVLSAIEHYQRCSHANVHRGVHLLSQRATEAFEGARLTVQRHLNAASTREIVFTRGATEGINLVAQSWGRANLKAGDEILITGLEHHANIVPWQMLCAASGAVLKSVAVADDGSISPAAFAAAITSRTRLIAMAQVSNALGTVLPVSEVSRLARARGIVLLIDGAQAVPHTPVDVQALGADFYVFSAHKAYGPTGIGVLYAREALLAAMPPWQGGGDMIKSVTLEHSTWNDLPWRFEAGTPNISGAVGLAAALDYVNAHGLKHIAAHEQALAEQARTALAAIPGVRLIGTAPQRAAVVSFVMAGVHPHDIGTVLDAEGVAIRTGHHCAMPAMQRFGLPATARASFGCYNTADDVGRLLEALGKVREVFH